MELYDRNSLHVNMPKHNLKKSLFFVIIAIIFAVVLPILIACLNNIVYKGHYIVLNSLTVHSSIEIACSIAALILACVYLLMLDLPKNNNNYYIWIVCSMVSMAVPDIFHSLVNPSDAFVWFYSLGAVGGGFFMLLTWFPISSKLKLSLPLLTALLLIFYCTFGIIYPGIIPNSIIKGVFTLPGIVLNIVGGLFYFIGSLFFIVKYIKNREFDNYLLMVFCFFLGAAGVIFPLSEIWVIDWWLWHFLRLIACISILIYVLYIFNKTKRDLEKSSDIADAILDASLEFKWFLNSDFIILRVNRTFSEALSIPVESIQGRKCYDIIKCNLCNTTKCPLQRMINKEKNIINIKNLHILTSQKTEFIIDATCAAVYNRKGSFIGMSENFLDITANKEYENKIRIESDIRKEINELSLIVQKDIGINKISENIITFICNYLNAKVGIFYTCLNELDFKLSGDFASDILDEKIENFATRSGLLGQAIKDGKRIIINDIPDNYINISSALGSTKPNYLLIQPFIFNSSVNSAMEIGITNALTEKQFSFLDRISEIVATAVNTALSKEKTNELLKETQGQAEELQSQQEELQSQQKELLASNEELEEQTGKLKKSEARLLTQQEELQTSNEELEEKSEALTEQKNKIEEKSKELAISSKYKSEFLANMSHEIRTPLNSLMLLSKRFTKNKKGNLDDDQIQDADIIYSQGEELLNLINEILDLSKIEAGQMTVNIEKIRIEDLKQKLKNSFGHMINDKGLEFFIETEANLPEFLQTDRQRLEQIVKNLLSNALKFTEEGKISIKIGRPEKDADLSRSGLNIDKAVSIAVTDTGIGISKDKQLAIFEAFQQADGSTARNYGGTGLGLSISKELVRLLGGELQLISEKGKGSTFTLYIKDCLKIRTAERTVTYESTTPKPAILKQEETSANNPVTPFLKDDSANFKKTDKIILLIEDDLIFAQIVFDSCKAKGYKFIHAGDGGKGLEMAHKYEPNAILLDISLPSKDIQGLQLLDILKSDITTRHIPVQIISNEAKPNEAMKKGAIGFSQKPVTEEQLESLLDHFSSLLNKKNKLLIIEDNKIQLESIKELLNSKNSLIDAAVNGKEAISKFQKNDYDCIVLDLTLPDITGLQVLEQIEKIKIVPPVVIYTGKDVSQKEHLALRKYTDSIIIKNPVSEERLLEEVSLFLHSNVSDYNKKSSTILSGCFTLDKFMQGKTVLIVDDDMRNLYALQAELRDYNIITIKAFDGKEAIEVLGQNSSIDLVLMDIMMPVMDGYEAMTTIRKKKEWKDLPIIALTAKAMKEDREICIAAGANDYIVKPVDIDKLLSTMRIWMK